MIFRRFSRGLIDTAIDPQERTIIEDVLNKYFTDDVECHALHNRQVGHAGLSAFISW